MATPLLFITSAISSYLITAFYLYRASRHGRLIVLAMLVAMLYGLSLELLDIRTLHGYFYQRVLIMIGGFPDWVPLAIAATWGTVFYVVSTTSNRFGLTWYQRPMVDGLLALSLDLILDPIMSKSRLVARVGEFCASGSFPPGKDVGLGMWVWCVPETDRALWFGVPVANFFGWFLVVAFLSFAVRFAIRWTHAESKNAWFQIGVLLAAAAIALVVFMPIQIAFSHLNPTLGWILTGVVAAFPFFFVLRAGFKPRHVDKPDLWVLAFPVLVCVSGFTTCFYADLYKKDAQLLWGILLVSLATIAVYTWPFVGRWIYRQGVLSMSADERP